MTLTLGRLPALSTSTKFDLGTDPHEWAAVLALCQQLGIKADYGEWNGIAYTHAGLNFESRFYPTRGVAAVKSVRERFNLSEEIGVPRVFSIENVTTRGVSGITFGPAIGDRIALARTWAIAFGYFLADMKVDHRLDLTSAAHLT